MTQLNIYLTFNGDCREAMTFYQSCLGGSLEMQSFGQAPGSENIAEDKKNHIMHATLTNGGLLLMASDTSTSHTEVTTGSSITLSLNCSSEEEIDSFFAKLSEGGKITMPLEMTFWGAKFGMLTDKFGMPWMLNYDLKD